MKKFLAASAVAAFCLAVAALADDEKKPMGGKANEGTIMKMDSAAKMMMVKDSMGKETAVYWNDSTKVGGGEMKKGALVNWKGTEKDGKMWAAWVLVGGLKKM